MDEHMQGQPARRKLREAEEARLELSAALKLAGVQLPAADTGFDISVAASGCPLVQLGSVSAPVARQLAEVVRKGAMA